MIIKTSSRKKPSYRQLLEYIMSDQGKLKDPEKESFVLTHNLKGSTIADWEQEFRHNESFRKRKRSNQVYLTHEILSWHEADTPHLSLEAIEDMTWQYMQTRNPNGMYVAVAHLSTDHPHVHLCVSGNEYRSGKAMRMSKKRFADVKKEIELYQRSQYPELIHSQVQHGRGKQHIKDKEFQMKRRTRQNSNNEKLMAVIEESLQTAESLEELLDLLIQQGAEPYYRRGKLTGLVWQGRKYRLGRLGLGKTNWREREQKQIVHPVPGSMHR